MDVNVTDNTWRCVVKANEPRSMWITPWWRLKCNDINTVTYVRHGSVERSTASRYAYTVWRNCQRLLQKRPPLWSIGQTSWLQTQKPWVRFPVLPDFLSSNGSGTGSTQPLGINEELLERKVAAPVYKTEINGHGGSAALTMRHLSILKSWH
jgi:hypothetical protein